MAYNDSFIKITGDSLEIKDYYFPVLGSKHIPFADIGVVQVLRPTLLNGKYRIWGGGVGVWFAMDFLRPTREAIFVVSIKDSWMKAGFSAGNSEAVVKELRAKGVRVEIEE